MGAAFARWKIRNIDTTTPVFSFNNYEEIVKVCNVYDGDTCHVVFKKWGMIIRVRVRMAHYDSPEIKGQTEEEKRAAAIAKEYFISLLQRSDMYAKAVFGRNDKYGRPLTTLYNISKWGICDAKSINTYMLESGNGKPYEGGKKTEFTEE